VSVDGKSLGSFNVNDPAQRAAAEKKQRQNKDSYFGTPKSASEEKADFQVIYNTTGDRLAGISGNGYSRIYNIRDKNDLEEVNRLVEENPGLITTNIPSAPTVATPISDRDYFNKFGVTIKGFNDYSKKDQDYLRGLPVLTDKDYFAKYGVEKDQFNALDKETQQYLMGLPVLTDKDYMSKYGMPKDEFMALPTETKNRLARVTPERKTVVVEGQIIDITEGKAPVAIFGDTKVKTITLDGEVLDITDPENVKVLYGDKKRDIRIVRGQLVEVTEDGTKAIFGERTPLNGTFENMILSNGDNIIVKKVGEDLYDKTGAVIDLNSSKYTDAVLVSKDKAFSEARLASSMAEAKQKLKALRQDVGDDFLGKQINKPTESLQKLGVAGGANVSRRTFDALKAARQGVGFWNKLGQVFSEKVGGIIPALENLAANQVEAGNFIDAVNVLGRVALANSPRFAEAEQQRLANLFPSTDNFLANPANAIRRLVGLKRLMRQEYENNLDVLSRSSNASIRQQAEQQNYAIEGVLKMLETIPDRGFVDETKFDATMEEIMKRRQERGAQ
jgi:hypothetical protein